MDIARELEGLSCDVFIVHTPEEPGILKTIFPGANFFPQTGQGLGERMNTALTRVLAKGYDACILTGSDLPDLTANHIEKAFHALEVSDIVISPSCDGGYSLIGMKVPCPELFEIGGYGGGSVYQKTLARAEISGKTLTRMDGLNDVDTPQDLVALWQRTRDQESHTAAFLSTVLGGSL